MKHSPEFEAIVDEARPRVTEISIDDYLARRDQVTLVDVREDSEFAAGAIPSAEHIGRGVLERDIVAKHPNKDEELVLYCGGGYRSILAADNLQKMGYRRVRSLIGGWREWKTRNPGA